MSDPKPTNTEWDAIVIGAGPAGALSAYLLAKKFARVLLVDKGVFPRTKVCGCCINSAAAQILESHSLRYILEENGAIALSSLKLFDGNRAATVSLPGGFALSRSAFDMALAHASVRQGATFLQETSALVLEATPNGRTVQLQTGTNTSLTEAKVVLVADGIGGHSLNQLTELDFVTDANSRYGCGTIIESAPDFYEAGKIYMACSPGGYVGLVRLEDGRVDIAAALDRQFSRIHSGPASASVNILESSRLPVPDLLRTAQWAGTETLTRRRKQIAAERLFILGDACGYAEPFTGEGIAWALASATALAELAASSIAQWSPSLISAWQHKHKQMLQFRQDRSILIAHALRKDTIRRLAIPLIDSFPSISNLVVKYISSGDLARAATATGQLQVSH